MPAYIHSFRFGLISHRLEDYTQLYIYIYDIYTTYLLYSFRWKHKPTYNMLQLGVLLVGISPPVCMWITGGISRENLPQTIGFC